MKTVKLINDEDWDKLVKKTYDRPYMFQQQEGCRERGMFYLEVPSEDDCDYKADEVPEEVNHLEKGVSFSAWLTRNPKKPLAEQAHGYQLDMWWERNFYPSPEVIANDLHKKGLLEAGKYVIEIHW
jgi:hypothetical protein